MILSKAFPLLLSLPSWSAAGLPAAAQDDPQTSASACSPKVYAALREPASEEKSSIEIRCSLSLEASDVITKQVLISGERASGIVIDCGGAVLDGSRGTVNFGKPTIRIRSTKAKDGGWSVPSDITIRNCTVKGAIRLQGLGANGQGEQVRLSSLTPGHTERAQQAAPSNVTISQVNFVADGGIPLYAGPGVTNMTVTQSNFSGYSVGTAIYLDAESARNTILDNRFEIKTKARELIAVDGSANNLIARNDFVDPINGGIFLYRNCGEGGTIRHQTPEYNRIVDNTFSYSMDWTEAQPAVWLNSRNGARLFCLYAPSANFGSGLSSLDFAENNTVSRNHLAGGDLSLIRDNDETNTVEGNNAE